MSYSKVDVQLLYQYTNNLQRSHKIHWKVLDGNFLRLYGYTCSAIQHSPLDFPIQVPVSKVLRHIVKNDRKLTVNIMHFPARLEISKALEQLIGQMPFWTHQ